MWGIALGVGITCVVGIFIWVRLTTSEQPPEPVQFVPPEQTAERVEAEQTHEQAEQAIRTAERQEDGMNDYVKARIAERRR